MFRKLDLFSSSGERRETPVLLDPLESNILNYCTHTVLRASTACYKDSFTF
jgi:hypothetical protein